MRLRCSRFALALSLLGLACTPAPPPPAPAQPPGPGFDANRAWTHLEALAAIGPRVMGSEGAAQARAYLREQLEQLDLEVVEQPVRVERAGDAGTLRLRNLGAVIPGASDDVFLLVAPYDTRRAEGFVNPGVNEGASGAAVLLEIARVLAGDPLPYTTWIVFLEGEAPLAPIGVPASPSQLGSRALMQRLAARGDLEQIRIVLALGRVCASDLVLARDLGSHRVYREEIWRAAQRLGHADAFPADAPFASPAAIHQPFAAAGLRRLVVLTDARPGTDTATGSAGDDDLAHCSPASLAAVGEVVIEGLDAIGAHLTRIDRFASRHVEVDRELHLEDLKQADDEAGGSAGPPSAEGPEAEEP